jgi:sugar-specific transcriptional regulator TrmB
MDGLILAFEELLRRPFGLTAYETRAYIALLRNSLTVSQIAESARIPRPRVYDTLRTLEEKGFVAEAGEEGAYHAVRPSTALRSRLARYKSDFLALQASMEEAMKKIVALADTSPGKDSLMEPQMLRGIDPIAGRFIDILDSSKQVFLVVRKGMRASSEFLGYLSSSGNLRARVRILVPPSARLTQREKVESARLGIEVRKSPMALLDMMVGDDQVILGVPARGEQESFKAVAVWVKDRSFSTELRSTLEKAWRDSSP